MQEQACESVDHGAGEGQLEGETKAADEGEAEFSFGLFSDKSQHIQWQSVVKFHL